MVSTDAPNAKAGVLAELARHAALSVLLVNDSDITVDPGYLEAVTAPLEDPAIGLVTCLYRAAGGFPGARTGSPGHRHRIRSQRAGGAPAGGGRIRPGIDHGIPRGRCCRKIGGFEAIAGYTRRRLSAGAATSAGWATASSSRRWWWTRISGAGSWGEVWRHQLRWSRTIRVSRPGGYYGYVVTHATFWALVAFAARAMVGRVPGAGRAHRRRSGGGAGILGDRRAAATSGSFRSATCSDSRSGWPARSEAASPGATKRSTCARTAESNLDGSPVRQLA